MGSMIARSTESRWIQSWSFSFVLYMFFLFYSHFTVKDTPSYSVGFLLFKHLLKRETKNLTQVNIQWKSEKESTLPVPGFLSALATHRVTWSLSETWISVPHRDSDSVHLGSRDQYFLKLCRWFQCTVQVQSHWLVLITIWQLTEVCVYYWCKIIV